MTTLARTHVAARRSVPPFDLILLIATLVLGCVFLGIKSVEYYHKFVEHHVPGPAV